MWQVRLSVLGVILQIADAAGNSKSHKRGPEEHVPTRAHCGKPGKDTGWQHSQALEHLGRKRQREPGLKGLGPGQGIGH